MKTQPGWFFGKDRLIKLMHLPPGFIVGIWRVSDVIVQLFVFTQKQSEELRWISASASRGRHRPAETENTQTH